MNEIIEARTDPGHWRGGQLESWLWNSLGSPVDPDLVAAQWAMVLLLRSANPDREFRIDVPETVAAVRHFDQLKRQLDASIQFARVFDQFIGGRLDERIVILDEAIIAARKVAEERVVTLVANAELSPSLCDRFLNDVSTTYEDAIPLKAELIRAGKWRIETTSTARRATISVPELKSRFVPDASEVPSVDWTGIGESLANAHMNEIFESLIQNGTRTKSQDAATELIRALDALESANSSAIAILVSSHEQVQSLVFTHPDFSAGSGLLGRSRGLGFLKEVPVFEVNTSKSKNIVVIGSRASLSISQLKRTADKSAVPFELRVDEVDLARASQLRARSGGAWSDIGEPSQIAGRYVEVNAGSPISIRSERPEQILVIELVDDRRESQ